jgi:hypothetical protein
MVQNGQQPALTLKCFRRFDRLARVQAVQVDLFDGDGQFGPVCIHRTINRSKAAHTKLRQQAIALM